jgi:hypothetical protein
MYIYLGILVFLAVSALLFAGLGGDFAPWDSQPLSTAAEHHAKGRFIELEGIRWSN